MLKKAFYNIFLVVALSVLLINLCQVQADKSEYPNLSSRNIEKNKYFASRLGMPFRIYKSTHASEMSTTSTTRTTTEMPKVQAYQYSIDSIKDELSKISGINFIRNFLSECYQVYITKKTTTTEKPEVFLHEAYLRFGRK